MAVRADGQVTSYAPDRVPGIERVRTRPQSPRVVAILAWGLAATSWCLGQGPWDADPNPFACPPVLPLPVVGGPGESAEVELHRLPPIDLVPGFPNGFPNGEPRMSSHERFVAAPNDPPTSDDELRRQVEQLQKEWKDFQAAEARKKEEVAGRPTFRLSGQIQVDALWFSQDTTSRTAVGDVQDSLNLRRVRLSVRGEAFEVYDYALGYGFRAGRGG